MRSIAFPAIATGVYGFPTAQAARVAVTTIVAADTDATLARLVAFDPEIHAALLQHLDG